MRYKVDPKVIAHIRKYAGKVSAKDLGKELGENEDRVRSIASNAGISLRLDDSKRKRKAKQLRNYILRNHKKMTAKQIAIIKKETINTIYAIGSVLGIDFKREPGYGPKEIVMADKNGFFNEMAHGTWLV